MRSGLFKLLICLTLRTNSIPAKTLQSYVNAHLRWQLAAYCRAFKKHEHHRWWEALTRHSEGVGPPDDNCDGGEKAYRQLVCPQARKHLGEVNAAYSWADAKIERVDGQDVNGLAGNWWRDNCALILTMKNGFGPTVSLAKCKLMAYISLWSNS